MVTEADVRVGGEIPSMCGAKLCKTDRLHTVIAKVGNKIVKAQCNVCGATHRYRAPQDVKDAQKKSKSSARASKTKATRSRREPAKPTPTVKPDMSLPVRNYSMSGEYTPTERIFHKKFGEGIVEECKTGKITVFFTETFERKQLVVGRPE